MLVGWWNTCLIEAVFFGSVPSWPFFSLRFLGDSVKYLVFSQMNDRHVKQFTAFTFVALFLFLKRVLPLNAECESVGSLQ